MVYAREKKVDKDAKYQINKVDVYSREEFLGKVIKFWD